MVDVKRCDSCAKIGSGLGWHKLGIDIGVHTRNFDVCSWDCIHELRGRFDLSPGRPFPAVVRN